MRTAGIATENDARTTGDRAPEWRRFSVRRGRPRAERTTRGGEAELVWVSGSPWTVHYVRMNERS